MSNPTCPIKKYAILDESKITAGKSQEQKFKNSF